MQAHEVRRIGIRPGDRPYSPRVELGVAHLVNPGEVEWPAIGIDLRTLVDLSPAQVVVSGRELESRADRGFAEGSRTPGPSKLCAVCRVVHLADQRPPALLLPSNQRLSISSS